MTMHPSTEGAVYLLPLSEAWKIGPAVAGAKATSLSVLLQARFPVPHGWVLTTTAFEQSLLPAGGSDGPAPAAFAIPDDVEQALAAIIAEAGGALLAVRSSALAEDLPDASYAGQYDTVLGVQGIDALREAVKRCWASAFNARVLSYLEQRKETGVAPMAVLVQRLVPAEAAGVAFTADPVTGDRDQVVVSAVRGLGERLVSGEVTPDEWVVRGNAAESRGLPEKALDEEQVRQIAEVARRIEAHFGAPQDIEWAWADGQVHILQSRPITRLPQRPELDIPTKGSWSKDVAHAGGLMTPFGESILPATESGIETMCREFGLLIDKLEQRSFSGEIYVRAVPFGGEGGPTPPWWLLAVLVRVVPSIRKRLNVAKQAVRTGLLESLPDQWDAGLRDQFRQEARRLLDSDMPSMDDPALLQHLDHAMDFLHKGQETHFRLFIPYVVAVHDLVTACRDLLGWDKVKALELVAGLSSASSEPGRMLARLADQVRERPTGFEALRSPGPDIVARLSDVDAELGAALAEYIARYGHRTVEYDPGTPTLAERPELLAGLLRDAATAGPSDDLDERNVQRRAEAESRAQESLDGRGQAERDRFAQVLATARRCYPLREDNVFWTDNIPCGILRGVMLEMGRRLAGRGLLLRAEDAAMLKLDELRSALVGTGGDDPTAATAARRQAEHAWVLAHPGPLTYGPPEGAPPDIRGLPAEARRINGALMWMMDEEFGEKQGGISDDGIKGLPGSPGRYTGTVRIVKGEPDFNKLLPGEVLVCPITTPAWSVLFANAGALVTDGGSAMSHAAIIAREFGVPAVVATGVATNTLKDGQVITVDGTRGMVTLTDHAHL